MTGIGGDAFMLVYSAKTKKLEALNASGRAPKALTLERVTSLGNKQMPLAGMETITVPGAFDGWVTLLEKHGTMKLPDLLAPAIALAENGFPVMEKTVADWIPEVEKLKRPDPLQDLRVLVECAADEDQVAVETRRVRGSGAEHEGEQDGACGEGRRRPWCAHGTPLFVEWRSRYKNRYSTSIRNKHYGRFREPDPRPHRIQ